MLVSEGQVVSLRVREFVSVFVSSLSEFVIEVEVVVGERE